VGRKAELAELDHLLGAVTKGRRADRGIAVLMRGRRRVGKSRLANEFVVRSGVPSMYFQAARAAAAQQEFALLADAIAGSSLPGRTVAAGTRPTSLTAALTLLAAALPDDRPSIAVIDDVPWLLEGITGGAGELQRVWDHQLAAKPVLLLLLGSDLAMMEHLALPDQPFHGRATEQVLDQLTPRDVARLTGLGAFDAFDAYLMTGGLPLVAQEWERGMTRAEFLSASFGRSTSALVVSGARLLDSEFGEATLARAVLTAIGGKGERTFTGVQQGATRGPLLPATLSAGLTKLSRKRVVAADEPLSSKSAPKDKRWRIADPSLRFWLAFVEPALAEVDRGRPDLAVARVDSGFEAWRGRAVEPVVRAALERLLPDETWPDVTRVGGWWPRTNRPEIDLVGVDRVPARQVSFAGTIKWRQTRRMTRAEVGRLADDALRVPGVDSSTPLVAVCPAGHVADPRLVTTWTASDLLAAWR
jgi:AAA+ ATPase superfamily predicted ATPase